MGLFDSLYVSLKCPATGLEKEIEIQFKWADPYMKSYHVSDQLEVGPYGNIWIPEDYVCNQCSEYEPMEFGKMLKKYVSHNAFIHLNQGKFEEVIPEEEFAGKYVQDGKIKLSPGESLFIQYFNFSEGKPAYLQELNIFK